MVRDKKFIKNLSGVSTEALKAVSFTAEPGEFIVSSRKKRFWKIYPIKMCQSTG